MVDLNNTTNFQKMIKEISINDILQLQVLKYPSKVA